MKKYLSVCFALLFAALNAQDCNQILLGEVIDFHDGTPLFGATITVTGTDITAVTDFNGKFTLEGLCNGTIEVRIEHPDCVILTSKVSIEGNTYQKFTMEHHMEELGEVVVTESRVIKNTKTAQEQLITSETIDRYSGQSLGDALKEISGVSSLNTGSTIVKPVIQGLHSSRVIIMNSGVRMQDQEWGSEHAPQLDLNSATSLSVIKGAAALKYGGDAIGGIIIAEPQKLALRDTLYGSTLVTGATNGRGGTLSSSLVKGYESGWNWKLQGSVKRMGDFEAPDYILSNTGVFQKGFSSSFGYNSLEYGFDAYYSFFQNEIGILRASHIGNVADLIRALNSDRPLVIRDFTYSILAPKQDVTHHLARIKAFKRISGVGKWNLQYDFQHNNRLEFDIRRGEDNKDRPSLDLTLTTHTLNTDFVYDARTNLKLNAGVRVMYQTNFPDPATGVKRLIPDYDRFDAGVFVTGDYHLGNNWLAEAGLRYDFTRMDAQKFYDIDSWQEEGYDQKYPEFEEGIFGTEILVNPVLDYHNISATAGVRYTTNTYEWLFNYALASRPPNPSELFSDGLHHSAAAIEIGALDLTSEVSHKLSTSFSKTQGALNFSISPYLNFIKGFILLEPSGLQETIRGAFPVWKYRQTDATMVGIDVDAAYQYDAQWQSDHKFSYVYGQDLDRDVALIDIPSANLMNRMTFSSPEFYGLQVSARSELVFRQTNYPDNRFTFPVFENGVLVDKVLDLSTPPPTYHLLGADASVAFDLSENTNLQVTLIGSNLLNTRYREYLNRQRFFADDLGRNIQLQLKLNY